MNLHGTSRINERGHLEIGGCDTVHLVEKFGTPLYILDEQLIRERCRAFVDAFQQTGLAFQVAYASKALSTMALCRIVAEEGLSLDVVSDGELYTALEAGFPAERIHFHGNNKTPFELKMALEADIGCIVVDNFVELRLLQQLAMEREQKVDVLLRLTPEVETHTHEYIQTGQVDSKFGFSLVDGQALQAVGQSLRSPNIRLLGFHAHIGSQIFEVHDYEHVIKKLGSFATACFEKYDFVTEVINVGGGFGIRYVDEDQPLPIHAYVKAIADQVKRTFRDYPHIPAVWTEPGRSIVGEAGTTLYRVGTEKRIPGVRHYIAVDGGMTDNPRPALYQAKYEAMLANKALEPNCEIVSVAGKCCESGDMLIWDLELPQVEMGDILAVSSTGAYNYSMASHYNRIRKPAVVLVQDGKADVIVKRETLSDLIAHDVIPERLSKQSV